jgi:hypothetical protein
MRDLRLIDAGTCDRFRRLSSAEAARLAGRSEAFAISVSVASTARPPGLLLKDAYRAYETGAATQRRYNTLLCNFAAVNQLDLLETVLLGRGRWTEAVAYADPTTTASRPSRKLRRPSTRTVIMALTLPLAAVNSPPL